MKGTGTDRSSFEAHGRPTCKEAASKVISRNLLLGQMLLPKLTAG